MGIPHICKNEQRVSSLGLVEYNDGKDVCTFVDNEYYLEKLSDNIQMVLIGEDLLDTLKQYRKSYGICVCLLYTSASGENVYGAKKIGNTWYYFDEKTGAMHTGWRDAGEKKRYYNDKGCLLYTSRCV